MSRTPRKPDADPYRKARWREQARAIVMKDRHHRKYGRAVDTGGAVAQALERAYKQGFADAQGETAPAARDASSQTALDWALIPPRPRNAFWSCCLFLFGRSGDRRRQGWLEPYVTERGTPGWRLVVVGFEPEKAMGANSIRPLVRLGLLDADGDASHRLTVTALGRATWDRFLARGGEFPEDLTNL